MSQGERIQTHDYGPKENVFKLWIVGQGERIQTLIVGQGKHIQNLIMG